MDTSIRAYDFHQPVRISSGQVKDVRRRLGGTDRLLSSYYSAHLQTPVDVSLEAVQSVPYSIAEQECATPGLVAQMRCEDSTWLAQSPCFLVDALIENLMGGSRATVVPPRLLTALDRLIIAEFLKDVGRRVASALLPELPDSKHPTVSGLETEVRLLPRVYAPDAAMLRVRYCFQFRDLKEALTWYLPASLARGKEPQSRVYPASSEPLDERVQDLNGLQVRVTAELPMVPLTLAEVSQLRTGQILPVQGAAILRVGRTCRFRIRPGQVGEHLGAEIVAVLAEEENRS